MTTCLCPTLFICLINQLNSRLKRILLALPYRPFLNIRTRRLPTSFTLTRLRRTRMLQRTRRLTRLHRFFRLRYHTFLRRLIRILLPLHFKVNLTRFIFLHFRLLFRYHFRPNLRSPHHLLLIRTRHRLPKRFIFLYFRLIKILIFRLNPRIGLLFRPKKYFLRIFTRRRLPRYLMYLLPGLTKDIYLKQSVSKETSVPIHYQMIRVNNRSYKFESRNKL